MVATIARDAAHTTHPVAVFGKFQSKPIVLPTIGRNTTEMNDITAMIM